MIWEKRGVLPDKVILEPSFKLENFNLKTIKSERHFSGFLGGKSRLLCKSLPFLTFVKILKFEKDRVVMGAYDDSRDSVSKMQIRTC